MLKRFLPIPAFLLSCSVLFAQPGNNAAEFFKQGIDYKNKNMLPEAMVAFKKAIKLNKNYDSAYIEIAIINVKTDKIDSAIFNVKKAITINPKMAWAHTTLGTIYRDSKPNYDSALLCYMAAVNIDSTNKVIYYSIAWCYNTKKDYKNAIRFAVKALDLDNTYRPAYAELGHAYNASKKYTEAIEQFKKNIAVSIVDLPIYYSGLCYTQLNDKEAALKQYKELKKLNEKMAGRLLKAIDNMK